MWERSLAVALAVSGAGCALADGLAGGGRESPCDPQVLDAYELSGIVHGVALDLAEQRLYVANGSEGLTVLDVSSPNDVARLGGFSVGGIEDSQTRSIELKFGLAFLAEEDAQAAVRIVDPTDPTRITQVGYLPMDTPVAHLAIHDRYALVSLFSAGVAIVDVNIREAPTEVARIDTPGTARRIWVDGPGARAYVCDGVGGLRIWDLATPTDPVELGSIASMSSAEAVVVEDDRAYVAGGLSGLHVIDVSDPANPEELGAIDLGSETLDVAFRNGLAFVASSVDGLVVIDASVPTALRELGSARASNPPFARGVIVDDRIAYLADGFAGVYMHDISDAIGCGQ